MRTNIQHKEAQNFFSLFDAGVFDMHHTASVYWMLIAF